MKFLILLALLVPSLTHAEIDRKGNGGDLCEARFIQIRADLQSWIARGGAGGLHLPPQFSVDDYNRQMIEAIASSKVSCTELPVKIEGAEKTCVNYKNGDDDFSIVCNLKRFTALSESDQYVIVHHEFAGIAGLEVNSGPESTYTLSNQITGYLEDQAIKKLAINPIRRPTANASKVCGVVANNWDPRVGDKQALLYFQVQLYDLETGKRSNHFRVAEFSSAISNMSQFVQAGVCRADFSNPKIMNFNGENYYGCDCELEVNESTLDKGYFNLRTCSSAASGGYRKYLGWKLDVAEAQALYEAARFFGFCN